MHRIITLCLAALLTAGCERSGGADPTDLPSLPAATTSTTAAPTSTSVAGTASVPLTSTTSAATLPPLQGVSLELVGDGFEQAVWAGLDPTNGELLVIERRGRIRTIDGELRFDIEDRVGSGAREQGLLGIAFHPSDPDLFYVNYTQAGGDTVISEFTRVDGVMDPARERKLLEIRQPASNHNGGHLAFGPDDMLYVGMGDGGAADDRFENGQDPFTLLGAMLRLDVTPSGALAYTIPSDNPFVGTDDGNPLIWATGLRNPWRYGFDDGRLYVADVGQNAWEEVSVVPVDSSFADNFGWPVLEGSSCFRSANCDRSAGVGSDGFLVDMIEPVVEYSHAEGCSITGGVVLHDPAIPELDGFYIYGDFCAGFVRGFFGVEASGPAELLTDVGNISHFGVDGDGAALVVTLDGTVSRIVPVR